jgi:cytochrome b561
MSTTILEQAKFDPVIRTCHWLTLLLIGAIYTAAWTAHSGLAGEWYQPVMQLHRSLGLTVLALTVFRLAWRQRTRAPELPDDLHKLQKLAAKGAEAMLYLLLLTQPVLGLLQTGARGQAVNFYFLIHLSPVIAVNRPLARLLHDLHALTADALLILIGLHSAAALFHHFVRCDGVLQSMLPIASANVGIIRSDMICRRRSDK